MWSKKFFRNRTKIKPLRKSFFNYHIKIYYTLTKENCTVKTIIKIPYINCKLKCNITKIKRSLDFFVE